MAVVDLRSNRIKEKEVNLKYCTCKCNDEDLIVIKSAMSIQNSICFNFISSILIIADQFC